VSYQWPWVDLIAQFKYQAQPGWSGTLASLMHSAPGVEDALALKPLLIPMPMHKLRWAERGFNPAMLLAQHLSPLDTCADVLWRVRHTPAQRSLPRRERLKNLEGAFQLDPLKTHLLRDRHVLLVDDVMTTGATLRSATNSLLAAGPASVSIVVLARTERPGTNVT
jgi:ComF family protein